MNFRSSSIACHENKLEQFHEKTRYHMQTTLLNKAQGTDRLADELPVNGDGGVNFEVDK